LLHRFHLALPIALLLSASVFAISCGGDDTTSSTPAAQPTAGATVAKAAYPVQVTDLLGRAVEIKAKPKAIVALSPSATEFVYAAGGTIIGRTTSVNFPEAAKAATDVGTAYQPNKEKIVALNPDLIVADSTIGGDPAMRKLIEGIGLPVVFAGADSYQKVLDSLTLMGKVLDSADTTKLKIAEIEKALADARTALGTTKVSALALISDRDRTLYAAKPSSYAGDILVKLGLTNPAATQPDAGPFPGYTTVAPEKLVEFNPDFLFTITPAPAPAPRLSTLIPQIPPFKGLKAVTTPNHVVEAEAQLFLEAPGPRVVLAFKAIVAAVTGKPAN
jgi:iron complex transport system substrate-binding protein